MSKHLSPTRFTIRLEIARLQRHYETAETEEIADELWIVIDCLKHELAYHARRGKT